MALGPLNPGWSPYSPYEYTDPVEVGPVNALQPLPPAPEPAEEPAEEPCNAPDGYCPDAYLAQGGAVMVRRATTEAWATKIKTAWNNITGSVTRIFYTILLFLVIGIVAFYFLKTKAIGAAQ